MDHYGNFKAIDLTSTQCSENDDVAPNTQLKISSILKATSWDVQNKKENFQEVDTVADDELQLDGSDVIIIDDEQEDPPPLAVISEIPQKTLKSVPLAEKILRILEVAQSPLIISEIQEKVGATYDRKLLEKLLLEQAAQGKVLVKTFAKLSIYCFNNKIKAASVREKRFYDFPIRLLI